MPDESEASVVAYEVQTEDLRAIRDQLAAQAAAIMTTRRRVVSAATLRRRRPDGGDRSLAGSA